MEHRSCENCVFSFDIPYSDYVECRRMPPINATVTKTGFPTTPKDAWCGEFNKKIDTEGWVQLGLFD